MILLFPFPFSCVSVMSESIKSDSILCLCKKSNSVFEALEGIEIKNVDTKSCEANDSLKSYLLKLLDIKAYTYYITQKATNEDLEKRFQTWIKNQSKERVDSMSRISELYDYYKDSIKASLFNSYLIMENEHPGISVKSKLFYDIKWKEAHVILLDLWSECIELRKKLNRNVQNSDFVYQYLLEYQNPEIWKYHIDVKIPKAIINDTLFINGYFVYKFKDDHDPFLYTKNRSVYDVDLFLTLLQFKKCHGYIRNYGGMGFRTDYTLCPFNIGLIYSSFFGNYLLHSQNKTVKDIVNTLFLNRYDLLYNQYTEGRGDYDKILPINNLPLEELEKISQKIIDNIDAFREALQPLIDEYEQRDSYWKKTMPYYKK